MRFPWFGRALPPGQQRPRDTQPVSGGGTMMPAQARGGWLRIFESFPGAWQQNVTLDRETVLTYFAVYACITLIASDLAKLRVKLVEQDDDDIWSETTSPAYSPVLRKPNNYQNRIQYWESYFLSKLTRGNTYVLKLRDARNVVTGLVILNPDRTIPLIAQDGSVFYQVHAPRELGWPEPDIVVPAREIIHDRMNCLYHPLLGTSPVWAAAYAATQGVAIQAGSAKFFQNASQPGGVLSAPGAIGDDTAARIKLAWETNFTGDNAGRVAVLGDGLEYERLALTAQESQLIEQLKWTADVICSVFHVPPYKIGLGTMPTYNNIQSLNVEYYSQCLQSLIEAAEVCLDEGLECPLGLGTEFDVDNLLRMDSVTQMTMLANGVKGVILAPNEARARLDLPPVKGGDSPIAQQQNYSLEALAKRDAAGPAPGSGGLPAPGGAQPSGGQQGEAAGGEPQDESTDTEAEGSPAAADQAAFAGWFNRSFAEALNA
jgi:HK97 family phage portal protein